MISMTSIICQQTKNYFCFLLALVKLFFSSWFHWNITEPCACISLLHVKNKSVFRLDIMFNYFPYVNTLCEFCI